LSGASGATSVEFKEAVLGMEVTPEVLPDGRITLTLHIRQNMPGRSVSRGGEALTIDKQEIKNQITVKDGETIVLRRIFNGLTGRQKTRCLGSAMFRYWDRYSNRAASSIKSANW